MTDSPMPTTNKNKRNTRGLIVLLLLLPLMCGVIVLASQIAANTRLTEIESTVKPIETADYSPWDRIIFAPVSEDIITQVVLEIAATIGDTSILGTATQAAVATNAQRTVIAQTPSATPTPIPSNTPLPTNTPTIRPTSTDEFNATEESISTGSPITTDGSTVASGTSIAQVSTADMTITAQAATAFASATNEAAVSSIEPTVASATSTAPVSTADRTNTAQASTTFASLNTETASSTSTVTPSTTLTQTPTRLRPTPILLVTDTPPPPTPIVLVTQTPTHTPDPIVAVFSASALSGTAPLTVQFTNLSVGNITSYQWSFGDGSTSNQASPSHTFSVSGSYYVRLDVFGSNGTSAAGTTIQVDVQATNTPIPTNPPAPTNPPPQPTNPPAPTNPPPQPTNPPVSPPPTNTPIPTSTPIPPTNTPIPTSTPIPPTNTPIPTSTPIPLTNTPVPVLIVTGLTLYNADTDSPIGAMSNGMTISYSAIGTNNINILASTNPAVVGSVDFTLPGVGGVNVDNSAPYFAAGDNPNNGNIFPMSPSVGTYTLTVIAYSSPGGGGTASTPVIITFTITN